MEMPKGGEQIPSPENTEKIDAEIKELLGTLDELNDLGEGETLYDRISPELQDQMYWVEQEANVGKDREQAKARLEDLITTLKSEAERFKGE